MRCNKKKLREQVQIINIKSFTVGWSHNRLLHCFQHGCYLSRSPVMTLYIYASAIFIGSPPVCHNSGPATWLSFSWKGWKCREAKLVSGPETSAFWVCSELTGDGWLTCTIIHITSAECSSSEAPESSNRAPSWQFHRREWIHCAPCWKLKWLVCPRSRTSPHTLALGLGNCGVWHKLQVDLKRQVKVWPLCKFEVCGLIIEHGIRSKNSIHAGTCRDQSSHVWEDKL